MPDLEPMNEDFDPRPNRALVLVALGEIEVLTRQGSGLDVGFEVDDLKDDLPKDAFGTYVWEGNWKQDGVESWEIPIPQYRLSGTFRPATPEEVASYLRGDFVWEVWPSRDEEDG